MLRLGKKFVVMLLVIFVVSSLVLAESCVAPVNMPTNPKSAPEVVSVTVDHKPVWVPPIIGCVMKYFNWCNL